MRSLGRPDVTLRLLLAESSEMWWTPIGDALPPVQAALKLHILNCLGYHAGIRPLEPDIWGRSASVRRQ